MTYDASEKLRYSGQPVECYKFFQGSQTWYHTSADKTIDLPIGSFDPFTISRGAWDFSSEDLSQTLEVSVPRTSEVGARFIGIPRSNSMGLVVYRAHRGDLTDYQTFFSGKVVKARAEGSEMILTCVTMFAGLRRTFPTLRMQSTCNHVWGSVGCGVSRAAFTDSITISSVSGTTVISNDFTARADGWFNGGLLISPDNEIRMIVDHVGDTVTLLSPMYGLASLDVCQAEAGDDHTEATCASKFSNRANFMGWSEIPTVNPFRGKID